MRYRVLIAAAMVMATVSGPSAAPDNTLGMALMSVTVDSASPPNIIRGAGAISVARPYGGIVDVVFDRDLSSCTCTASAGFHGLDGYYNANHFIAASCPFTANSVRVTTGTPNGNAANVAFHLIVFCAR